MLPQFFAVMRPWKSLRRNAGPDQVRTFVITPQGQLRMPAAKLSRAQLRLAQRAEDDSSRRADRPLVQRLRPTGAEDRRRHDRVNPFRVAAP